MSKTIGNKAFSAKRANMDRSRNDKMNEKHCGFCIFRPCRSYVAVDILAKSCRKTAFQARRRHAESCKIKNERKTLWVFTFFPPVLGPRFPKSWKTLGITSLRTPHNLANHVRKKTGREKTQSEMIENEKL